MEMTFSALCFQMICDSTCVITNIEAKWPGAVLDDRIFNESSLCAKFEQGSHTINPANFQTLDFACSSIDCDLTVCSPTGHYDGILLGDTDYTCRTFFMTPYPDPSPGPQAHFNASLAKTRSKIVTTLGQLRGRFQCLNGLRVVPDRACDITVACAVLHNIATIRKESTPPVCQPPDDDIESLYLDEPDGQAVRDRIAAQYFG